MSEERKPFIACNSSPAMSGHFATLYGWTEDPDGFSFWEPYESGFGRYATLDEAEAEGRRWAEEIGVEFVPVDRDRALRYETLSAKRTARVKQLRDEGVTLREAMRIAHEEFA